VNIFKTALAVSVVGVLALTIGLLSHPSGARANAAPSATGAGHFQVNGGLRTFSFTAHSTGPGTTAEGEAQLDNRGQGVFDHIHIDCMFIGGHTADIGGTITSSNNPTQVGLHGVFSVIDNGQGKNAPADQMTLFYIPDPGCIYHFTGLYYSIDGGSIHVRS
jgi:hypothetical protein